jgi:hypothetical protein
MAWLLGRRIQGIRQPAGPSGMPRAWFGTRVASVFAPDGSRTLYLLHHPGDLPVAAVPQVWVTASLDSQGRLVLGGGSDSELSAGVVAVLTQALSGMTPQELLQVRGRLTGASQRAVRCQVAARESSLWAQGRVWQGSVAILGQGGG